MSRRVVVAGASGLIGTALTHELTARGDDVVRLVRRDPAPGEVRWDPASRYLDPADLEGVDGVVNLAGAGVADHRWTASYRQLILSSRVDTTHALATAVAQVDQPVRLVVGTAVGIYGDRGEEVLTEASEPGTGFLTEVVRAWEGAAEPAVTAGRSVAFGRTGLVLAQGGGAAAPILRLARYGLAGPLGSGRQWWPWITLRDEVRALVHLLGSAVTGPVNLVGPAPAHQVDVARAIAARLHRPALLPAPGFALKLVLGGFAGDVLGSQRAVPERLAADGFVHVDRTLEDAAAYLVP